MFYLFYIELFWFYMVQYNQFYPKMFYIVLYDKFLQAEKNINVFTTWQRLSPLPQE